jgi:hypothetical protein
MTVTQIKGAVFGEGVSEIGLSTTQWYTQQSLKTATINYFVGQGLTQAQAEAAFNESMGPLMAEMFVTTTGTLNGNTLTIDGSAYTKSGAHTHTYGAWQTSATQHWKECSACGEEY